MKKFRGVAFKRPEAFHYLQFDFIVFRKRIFAAARRTLMKLTPGVDFTNTFTGCFYTHRSQNHKYSVKSSVSFFFCLWDLCAQKNLCIKCWWNWPLVKLSKSIQSFSLLIFFFANSTIFELSRATANDVLLLFDEELILRSEWGHQSFRNIGNISKTKTKIIDFFGIWGHL
jgi:hypothetical protein